MHLDYIELAKFNPPLSFFCFMYNPHVHAYRTMMYIYKIYIYLSVYMIHLGFANHFLRGKAYKILNLIIANQSWSQFVFHTFIFVINFYNITSKCSYENI